MADIEPGPLKSRLLRGNRRLQDCAQSDPAHVTPQEPSSFHVSLINDGLRRIFKENPGQGYVDVPAGVVDAYTDETRRAVIALKTKHRLFTRGTIGTIDPIVGTGTIRKMDELLAAKEKKLPTPAPVPPAKVVTLSLSGVCQLIGNRPDNAAADDMKFGDGLSARKSAKSLALTAPLMAADDTTLESLMVGAMASAVAITTPRGAFNAAALVAPGQCVLDFFSRGGVERVFARTSGVSIVAQTDSGFGIFVDSVRDLVRREVRAAHRAGLIDDRAIAAKLRPTLDSPGFPTGKFDSILTAMIGGFQGYRIELCGLVVNLAAKNFTYSLDMEILDHFGVDEDDINKPGAFGVGIGATMLSFFVLQHDRAGGPINKARSKYRPFRIRLQVVMGPFTDTI